MRGEVTIKFHFDDGPSDGALAELESKIMAELDDRIKKQNELYDAMGTAVSGISDDIRVMLDRLNDVTNVGGNMTTEQREAVAALDKKGNDLLERLRYLDGLNPNTPAPQVDEPLSDEEKARKQQEEDAARAAAAAPGNQPDPITGQTGGEDSRSVEQRIAEQKSGTTGVQPPGAQTSS